jgi:hypothetical protein
MWFVLLILLALPLHAKVDPQNYDFSTDTLAEFFPGQTLATIEAKYGKGELMRDKNGTRTLRFWVSQIRYKFPVLVQVDQEKVLDMFATLPSYFLHDIFHQSLIKRWGKQQKYKRVDEEAYYRWEDADKIMHYSASCTITCFPVYFSVGPGKDKAPAGFRSQHEQLQTTP